jgi:ribonuclease-3
VSASSDLEARIGHAFAGKALLDMALTHASTHGKDYDNERLEFLGDRVLGLVVAALLYKKFPDEEEGALAKRHTALVQRAMLARVGHDIGLQAHVKVSGAARQEAVIADAVEALIAAVYLDGGYAAAGDMVARLWTPYLDNGAAPPEDPKTALQEWAQARGLPLPEYKIAAQTGPAHAPVFEIELSVQGQAPVRAQAASKRAAEKDAAALMLQRLEGTA